MYIGGGVYDKPADFSQLAKQSYQSIIRPSLYSNDINQGGSQQISTNLFGFRDEPADSHSSLSGGAPSPDLSEMSAPIDIPSPKHSNAGGLHVTRTPGTTPSHSPTLPNGSSSSLLPPPAIASRGASSGPLHGRSHSNSPSRLDISYPSESSRQVVSSNVASVHPTGIAIAPSSKSFHAPTPKRPPPSNSTSTASPPSSSSIPIRSVSSYTIDDGDITASDVDDHTTLIRHPSSTPVPNPSYPQQSYNSGSRNNSQGVHHSSSSPPDNDDANGRSTIGGGKVPRRPVLVQLPGGAAKYGYPPYMRAASPRGSDTVASSIGSLSSSSSSGINCLGDSPLVKYSRTKWKQLTPTARERIMFCVSTLLGSILFIVLFQALLSVLTSMQEYSFQETLHDIKYPDHAYVHDHNRNHTQHDTINPTTGTINLAPHTSQDHHHSHIKLPILSPTTQQPSTPPSPPPHSSALPPTTTSTSTPSQHSRPPPKTSVFLASYVVSYLTSIFWQHGLNYYLVPSLSSQAFCAGLVHSYAVYSTSLALVVCASLTLVALNIPPDTVAIILIPVSGAINYYALRNWGCVSVYLGGLFGFSKHRDTSHIDTDSINTTSTAGTSTSPLPHENQLEMGSLVSPPQPPFVKVASTSSNSTASVQRGESHSKPLPASSVSSIPSTTNSMNDRASPSIVSTGSINSTLNVVSSSGNNNSGGGGGNSSSNNSSNAMTLNISVHNNSSSAKSMTDASFFAASAATVDKSQLEYYYGHHSARKSGYVSKHHRG